MRVCYKQPLINIAGTSHGINFEDMDVAALLKEDTEDDAFSEQKVCLIKF